MQLIAKAEARDSYLEHIERDMLPLICDQGSPAYMLTCVLRVPPRVHPLPTLACLYLLYDGFYRTQSEIIRLDQPPPPPLLLRLSKIYLGSGTFLPKLILGPKYS